MDTTSRTWLKDAVAAAGGVRSVAVASGLSVPFIYNLIRGRRSVTARAAASLRGVLDVEDARWLDAMQVCTVDSPGNDDRGEAA